jgi:hypothetical protein
VLEDDACFVERAVFAHDQSTVASARTQSESRAAADQATIAQFDRRSDTSISAPKS